MSPQSNRWFFNRSRRNVADYRSRHVRLRLEYLEDRLAPAGTVHNLSTGVNYTSIQAAVTAAAPGNTLLADAGTFQEHVVIDKSLTLEGANSGINPITSSRGPETVVDGTSTDAPFDIQANNVVIDGFEIINGQGGFNAGIATTGTDSGYTIENNIIADNQIGVDANCNGPSTIQNNLFFRNNLPGTNGGAGVYSHLGTNGLTITGNEFKGHTETNPILIVGAAPGANTNLTFTNNNLHDNSFGPFIQTVSGGLFQGNTISTLGTTGLTFGGADTNIQVLNNNLSNNARGLRVEDGGFSGTPNSNITAHFNNFANDSQFGLGIVDSPGFPGYIGTLDATRNYWGSPTGPTSPKNPGGTGSAVVDPDNQVIFDPWATDASFTTFSNANGVPATAYPLGLGAGANGAAPVVNVTANGAVVKTITPFPGFNGEVRVANSLLANGDPLYVYAAGPGGGPEVKVIDGKTGATLAAFYAFDPSFTGGVYVATGDVNHDGTPDIIVGAGAGGGPEVKVIDGTKLTQIQANGKIASSALLGDFYAYAPSFTGGVTVAAADFNGDGRADVVTGAGPGGGPEVKVVNAAKSGLIGANGEILNAALLADFYAYDPAFTGGVYVATGDFNGDLTPDLITGAGAGGGPEVKVIDGTKIGQNQANGEITNNALFADFYAYTPGFAGGVRVDTVQDLTTGEADVVTGAGPGGGPHVKVFRATDLAVLDSFFATDSAFTGGVFV